LLIIRRCSTSQVGSMTQWIRALLLLSGSNKPSSLRQSGLKMRTWLWWESQSIPIRMSSLLPTISKLRALTPITNHTDKHPNWKLTLRTQAPSQLWLKTKPKALWLAVAEAISASMPPTVGIQTLIKTWKHWGVWISIRLWTWPMLFSKSLRKTRSHQCYLQVKAKRTWGRIKTSRLRLISTVL